MNTPPRVLAIVLTHNAPDALLRCLHAIDGQTRLPDAILVVDNSSAPPVVVERGRAPIEVLRRELNDGPAGGHAAGLETLLARDEDVAWIMDDDCVPAPDCLARLLDHEVELADDRPVFPIWVDGPTGERRFLPAWCGFVIPRALVERIGLPRRDLVWWAEDTEYLQWRMRDAGVVVVEEPDAVVEHHRVRSTGRKPDWKVYYEVRNTIVYRVYVQPWTLNHGRLMARSLAKLLGQILRNGARSADLRAYARGVVDGFAKRTGMRVPLP
jgi:rhamnopyranosyl-N-acetylglucosaminyl-diphospho-decaprenol beta-1,3/1,4-galactofuranosyltransferase